MELSQVLEGKAATGIFWHANTLGLCAHRLGQKDR